MVHRISHLLLLFFTLWPRVAPPSHSYLDKTCHAGPGEFRRLLIHRTETAISTLTLPLIAFPEGAVASGFWVRKCCFVTIGHDVTSGNLRLSVSFLETCEMPFR